MIPGGSSLSARSKRRHKRFTKEESDELCRLWPTALPSKIIARRLDHPINSLRIRAKKLGLPTRPDARLKTVQQVAESGRSKPGSEAEARHDSLPPHPEAGSAASAPPKPMPRNFDEWWAGEKRLMRRAKRAVSVPGEWQGQPAMPAFNARILEWALKGKDRG